MIPPKFAAGVAAAFLCVAAVSGAEPDYSFTTKRAEDSIVAKVDGAQTTFLVTSKMGIGSGTIAIPTGAAWPKQIVIKLEKLKGLEGFTLTAGPMQAEGSLRESGKVPYFVQDATGRLDREHAAGTLDIVIEKRDDGIEIKLPSKVLQGKDKFEFQWVDFYRN
jgi:hypothetical protein